MKKVDRKYIGWGVTAFIVIALSICFIYLVFNSSVVLGGFSKFVKIMTPIIDGMILAYLLTPILNFIEKKWLSKLFAKMKIANTPKNKKRMRAVSIVITLLFVILVVGIFLSIVIPQLVLSIQSIIFQFPMYIDNLYTWTNGILIKNPQLEDIYNQIFTHYSESLTEFLQTDILPRVNTLIKTLSMSILGFVKSIWNFVIGFIISIYVLGSKEKFVRQGKEVAYALLEDSKSSKLVKAVKFMHNTFIGFLGGKIIDSVIIGIICFIATSIIGTPYSILISCIVGVTNIIPFFGPYIGAIPSAILVLMVNPKHCLYFIILILIIQQIDGNIIGPKILGDSTGLSSFWVIFAITVFGGLFGIVGMIIGVPVFAILYAGFKYYIKNKLRVKEAAKVRNEIPDTESE